MAQHDPEARIDSSSGTYDISGPESRDSGRESGTAGLPDADEVPAETVEGLEKERAERLADDNRPEGAEVDNTHRTFDSGSGMFTDNPDYDPASRPFAEPGDEAPPKA